MTSVTAVSVSCFSHARRLLCVAVLLPTTACHVWRVETLAPTSAFRATDRITVTKVDGSSVALVDAHIVNDSVIGIWAGSSTRMAFGVSDVRAVKVRRLSADRTVMVVLGIAAGTAVMAKAISDERSKPTDICAGCF